MEFWYKLLTFSLPAGRVGGIPLRLNWLLAFLAVFYVVQALLAGGPVSAAMVAMGLAILYGSILLHELGHAYGMYLVGISVSEIHLTPIGGVAVGEDAPPSPRTELIVVGLGPAVSAALAGIGWLLHLGVRSIEGGVPWFVSVPVQALAWINTGLLLFNMLLPIFPLDGAKILRASLSLKYPSQRVTYMLANAGIGLSILLLFAGFLRINLPVIGSGGPVLWLIFLLGIQSCWHTLRMLEFDRVYSSEDTWGDRSVHLDGEAMALARARFLATLGRVLPGGTPRPKAPRPAARAAGAPAPRKGPAKVIAIAPDPESIDDPAQLARLIREAADAEDFVLAQKLKRRLDQVRGGSGTQG
ncbi:MAG: hypothetical protein SF028_09550 [Candidatus Sumerlaeia bacterium]|nr:hypothetical protein [Candidatus Sumerlaeia bacterium]